MKKTIVVGLLTLGATAFGASNSFKVTLYQDSVIEGKMVRAGAYRISVGDGNAVLKQGKEAIVVPAREEMGTNKVEATELEYTNGTTLQAILMGGTQTKIVFENSAPMHSGL